MDVFGAGGGGGANYELVSLSLVENTVTTIRRRKKNNTHFVLSIAVKQWTWIVHM